MAINNNRKKSLLRSWVLLLGVGFPADRLQLCCLLRYWSWFNYLYNFIYISIYEIFKTCADYDKVQ
jgi:hypothetical protein